MTYIKLEDVMTMITKMDINIDNPSDRILQICLRDRINSLPSIKIEQLCDSVEDTVYVNWLLYVNAPELLNKLHK